MRPERLIPRRLKNSQKADCVAWEGHGMFREWVFLGVGLSLLTNKEGCHRATSECRTVLVFRCRSGNWQHEFGERELGGERWF